MQGPPRSQRSIREIRLAEQATQGPLPTGGGLGTPVRRGFGRARLPTKRGRIVTRRTDLLRARRRLCCQRCLRWLLLELNVRQASRHLFNRKAARALRSACIRASLSRLF